MGYYIKLFFCDIVIPYAHVNCLKEAIMEFEENFIENKDNKSNSWHYQSILDDPTDYDTTFEEMMEHHDWEIKDTEDGYLLNHWIWGDYDPKYDSRYLGNFLALFAPFLNYKDDKEYKIIFIGDDGTLMGLVFKDEIVTRTNI